MVVDRFTAAWTSGDVTSAREYLADDLDYSGTIISFTTPEQLLEVRRGLVHLTKDVVYVARVYDADRAALLYDLVTDTPAGSIRVAEFFRVAAGKIREIRLVFDPTSLRGEMSSMRPEGEAV